MPAQPDTSDTRSHCPDSACPLCGSTAASPASQAGELAALLAEVPAPDGEDALDNVGRPASHGTKEANT